MYNKNDYKSQYTAVSDEYGNYGQAPVVAGASPTTRAAFLRKVYITLTAGVAVSMLTGLGFVYHAATNENSIVRMMLASRGNMMVLFLAYLALSFLVGSLVQKRGINVLAYLFFTAFTGFFISPMLFVAAASTNSLTVIWQALGLTVFTFGGLSTYVLVSGKDFAFMKGFLWTGFWVLVGFMVVGLFYQSWAFQMGVSAAGLLVFAGFVLYHTSEIMHRYGPGDWVAGAFSLFIDFINMFIRILFLLMGRRD